MLRRRKPRAGCLPILLLVVLVVLLYSNRQQIKEIFFPLDYRGEIEHVAAEYGLDPWLIFAIIRQESNFQAAAKSAAGACGLMQLMPETAAWIIRVAGFDLEAEEAVWQPEENIRLGVWYMKWLADTYYEDNLIAALAAYNAGPSRVNRWLDEGIWQGNVDDLAAIPYAETRQYIQYVMEGYRLYRWLYAE